MIRAVLALFVCLPLLASAAEPMTPSDVVLNAYLSLRSEIAAKDVKRVDEAIARTQSHYWDYLQTTRAAFGEEWEAIESSERKWEMVSAVGAYLHAAMSRLMGSAHAVIGVQVTAENVTGRQAMVTAKISLASGGEPLAVYFLLGNTDQGWKIFDFNAPRAGFHLNLNLRSNTLPVLKRHGVEATIDHLKNIVK